MASVINTNMASLYAQKNLTGAQNALSTSVERLSSGLRINRAKDDAAGMAISEKITSQVRALNQGVRNANDAVSILQTAEGSLSQVGDILQRMKELSVQGQNGSLSTIQRTAIADELIQLRDEINAVADRTKYNGLNLLKNALHTEVVSSASDSSRVVNGASLVSGLSISALAVDSADVGSYTLSTRSQTVLTSAASNVSATATPSALVARTVTLDEGDIYDGAKVSISVNGVEYFAVAGQDDTASTMATKLVTKLTPDFASVVSSSSNVLTFASGASLGDADIEVKVSTLAANKIVSGTQSTVDAPYDSAGTARLVTLNDFDIVEGRKVTITVGSPDEVASFSTYIGAGADKDSVTADLEELIDDHFSNVSATNNVITFNGSASLGMAEIKLTFEDTVATENDVTLSEVSNKDNAAVARTIEINGNDVADGRVFSVTVAGKEYSYKATGNDTAATVAYGLADLLDKDYSSTTGSVTDPTVVNNIGAEIGTVTFSALRAGDVLTIGGLTYTATAAATATQVAADWGSLSDGATAGTSTSYGSWTGTLSGYDVAFTSGTSATFTSTAATLSDEADLTPAITPVAGTASSAAITTAGTAGSVAEVSAVTFRNMYAGDVLNIAGLTFTASADITATQLASAFASLAASATAGASTTLGAWTGTLTSYSSGAVSSSTLVSFTQASNSTVTTLTPTFTSAATSSTATTSTATDGSATSREAATVTFTAMKAGDSVTVDGLRFTANSTVTAAQAAAAFANLYDGATSGNGTEYGSYSGELRSFSSGSVSTSTVTFTATGLAGVNVTDLTASSEQKAAAVSLASGGNTITLTAAGAKLGTTEMSMTVSEFTNAGTLTLTANSDTGRGGTAQSISLGDIAAGGYKTVNFDQLGVSFALTNGSGATINSETFELESPQVSSLVIGASSVGTANFQVGSDSSDTIEISGFKDIRVNGANKNSNAAEAAVFNNLYTTATAVGAGNLDQDDFAALEVALDAAITEIANFRADFGAQQNRLEFAISNLQSQSENMTAANSRIRDTDYAAETANLTKTQIMQQAATAMLAQANQMPNVILALLK